MTDAVTVRAMMVADLGAVRDLMMQLGYDVAPDVLEARFAAVAVQADHAVFVAETDGAVTGLVHVFARPALEKPVEAVVQSLVVESTARGSGIGRELMARAEAWAHDRGLGSVALYTTVTRTEARAFYAALGYNEVAQSALLRRKLDTP